MVICDCFLIAFLLNNKQTHTQIYESTDLPTKVKNHLKNVLYKLRLFIKLRP